MKVVFSTYPMAFHTPGGGEVQLLQYKKYIPLESIEVDLLNPWKPDYFTYDLVHFFSCMSGSVHFCAFVKSIGLPLIVSPNLWITEENKSNYPFDEIRTQFVLSDKVICNSNMECELLAKTFNIPRDKFATVYNGVDESFFESSHPDLFKKTFNIDEPFVLNVANLESRKNQINLIKAMRSFPSLKLVLIGYDRDPAYANECMKEGGAQVIFIGPLPHDSPLLKSAYAGCHLFALPSTLETPGLAALEASVCGAKILITDQGCAREYFGEGAIYVNPLDVNDIADGIAKSLSAHQTLLQSFVIRSNYSWSHAVESLTHIYNKIAYSENDYFKIQNHGFHSIENDGQRLFAWSLPEFSFTSEPGFLSFFWRSYCTVCVDIYIDDQICQSKILVNSDWSTYSLEIFNSAKSKMRVVKFRINNFDCNEKPPSLAISNVSISNLNDHVEINSKSAVDVDFIKNIVNYHPTETTPSARQNWVKSESFFDCKIGLLNFWWHSLGGADVDIFIDDDVFGFNIKIPIDWALFSINIVDNGNEYRRVRMVANSKCSSVDSDARELAFAISNFSLTK
jgi:glycosyltransferase involved in cell wall biosynthesis